MPIQTKGILILYILEILKKHSDGEHRMSQQDIRDLLQKDYDLTVDRKTVRRDLETLVDCGYNIEYEEISRSMKNRSTGETE